NHTILIAKNGTEIAIDDSGSPIRDSDGETLGSVVIFRDVTERRRAERTQAELLERERLARQNERQMRLAVEAAEQRLQLALEAGHMGTWEYVIRSGNILSSPGLDQIHGYEPGTFPGTFDAFTKEIHPDDRERVLRTIRETLDGRRDHHVEYRIIRKDGT